MNRLRYTAENCTIGTVGPLEPALPLRLTYRGLTL